MKQTIWREFTMTLRDNLERAYSSIFHVQRIKPEDLFRLNLRHYHGPVLTLRDNTEVFPGDLIGELHLPNVELLDIQLKSSNPVQAVMSVKKTMKQHLSHLATLAAQEKLDPKVQAFYGITIFHQGARLLGFEVKEIESSFWKFCFQVSQLLLLEIYHPLGIRRLKQGHQSLSPKVIWISRATLIRDFLPHDP
jgi:hypothetical protein